MNKCQTCDENLATIHVTEVPKGYEIGSGPLERKHICEACAQRLQLPDMHVSGHKGTVDIWKLLQKSAQRARRQSGLSCPDCGMTLGEFRGKGRLGCPRDYEIFRDHLDVLLQRIQNATEHVGRIPGLGDSDLQRIAQLSDLRAKLQTAIRDEHYEDAAQLRDEIQTLETQSGV